LVPVKHAVSATVTANSNNQLVAMVTSNSK